MSDPVLVETNEIVYVLTNPGMPGLVKIGYTTNLEQRIRSLNAHSGVPAPFQCHYAAQVADADAKEQVLHELFADHRFNENREFFKLEPKKAELAMRLMEHREVTLPGVRPADPEEDEALEQEMKKAERRPPFNMDAEGIPTGAVLKFFRDDNITCTVLPGGWVEYNGERDSLSGSAAKILNRATSSGVQGPLYWKYEGKTLHERRLEREVA